MASLRYNDYSDSPTLVYPPHQHSFSNMNYPSVLSIPSLQSTRSQWVPVAPNTTLSTNPSRKRSREDDDDEAYNAAKVLPPKPQPIYGEGMTLIDPINGLAVSAESQTGTWYEDHLEIERLAAASAAESLARSKNRASLAPRKRLQYRSPSSNLSVSAGAISPRHNAEPTTFHTSEFLNTIANSLGTEWACLSDDDLLRSASRGWAKFIQRHYPSLNNVEILLRFKDKNMCLVRTNEGIFLFQEDLSEGRLVAKTWEACIVNLRATPMVFEGANNLKAEKDPADPTLDHIEVTARSSSDGSSQDVDTSSSSMDID